MGCDDRSFTCARRASRRHYPDDRPSTAARTRAHARRTRAPGWRLRLLSTIPHSPGSTAARRSLSFSLSFSLSLSLEGRRLGSSARNEEAARRCTFVWAARRCAFVRLRFELLRRAPTCELGSRRASVAGARRTCFRRRPARASRSRGASRTPSSSRTRCSARARKSELAPSRPARGGSARGGRRERTRGGCDVAPPLARGQTAARCDPKGVGGGLPH